MSKMRRCRMYVRIPHEGAIHEICPLCFPSVSDSVSVRFLYPRAQMRPDPLVIVEILGLESPICEIRLLP